MSRWGGLLAGLGIGALLGSMFGSQMGPLVGMLFTGPYKVQHLGWSSTMAPVIMGNADRPELGEELTNSFCRADPEIASHFARVTFLSDNRTDVPKLKVRSLILQCSDDIIAPRSVGDYMHKVLPDSTLKVIENIGHCPHLSSPGPVVDAMDTFLHQKVLRG